jgi:Tol biopolymer transport system component
LLQRGGELVSVAIATGKQTVLRAAAPRTLYEVTGGWSPDGKSVLYERFTARSGTVELARRDGTESRVLLRLDHPYPYELQTSWSADGRRVAFVEGTGVRLRPAHAGIVDIASGRVRFLAASPQTPLALAWAPDSRRLALSAVPPPRECCGDGIAVFSASGKLLHFTSTAAYEAGELSWARSGLYVVRGPQDTVLSRSPDGTAAPVSLFRLPRSDLGFAAIVPRALAG